MQKKITALNEKDKRNLQEVIRAEHRRVHNTQGRGREGAVDHEEHQAPETYVALSPIGGIAALTIDIETGTGTATGTEVGIGNTPGFADCDIYKVVYKGDVPNLFPVETLNKRVHNVSQTAIDGNTWIIITRDKFGIWFATGIVGEGAGTGTGGDELNVRELDGSPSHNNIIRITTDQSTGLKVRSTQSAANAADLYIDRCNEILVVTNVCPIFEETFDATGTGTGPAMMTGMRVEWSRINLLDPGCTVFEKWCDENRVDCCTEDDTGTASSTATS